VRVDVKVCSKTKCTSFFLNTVYYGRYRRQITWSRQKLRSGGSTPATRPIVKIVWPLVNVGKPIIKPESKNAYVSTNWRSLWPWLGYTLHGGVAELQNVMYFRFCGWRHVFTQWALLCVMRIRKWREQVSNSLSYRFRPASCSTIKIGNYTSNVSSALGAKSVVSNFLFVHCSQWNNLWSICPVYIVSEACWFTHRWNCSPGSHRRHYRYSCSYINSAKFWLRFVFLKDWILNIYESSIHFILLGAITIRAGCSLLLQTESVCLSVPWSRPWALQQRPIVSINRSRYHLGYWLRWAQGTAY